MSKQSREKKAVIYNESLRKQSRDICLIAAVILYVVVLMGTLGDSYAYIIIIPICTFLFLIGLAIIYFPARACVERFIAVRLKRKKRQVFLLLALVPYLCCIGFFFYCFIDYNYISSPDAIAQRAEDNFYHYQKLYNENADLLNYLNDTVMDNPGDTDDWQISRINCYNGNVIKVEIDYENGKRETLLLESSRELSEQEKEEIRLLMENVGKENANISFLHNDFRIQLSGRTEARFIKPQGESMNYIIAFSSVNIPLGDNWHFLITTMPPPA